MEKTRFSRFFNLPKLMSKQVKVDLPNRIAQSESYSEAQLKNKEMWQNNTHKTTGLDGEAQEAFAMTINGVKYLEEKKAVEALEKALDPMAKQEFTGEYKGFNIAISRILIANNWQSI